MKIKRPPKSGGQAPGTGNFVRSVAFLVGAAVSTAVAILIMRKQAELTEGEVAWRTSINAQHKSFQIEILKVPLDPSLLRSLMMPSDPEQAYICVFRVGERKLTTFRFESESFYPGKFSGRLLPADSESLFDRTKYPIQAVFYLGGMPIHCGTDLSRDAVWETGPYQPEGKWNIPAAGFLGQ